MNCDAAASKTLIMHWDGSTWRRVAGPPGSVTLAAVAATSARSAWGAGSYSSDAGATGTFTARWNGARWAKIPSPGRASRQAGPATLDGVAAVPAGAAWAAGESGTGNPLILGWTGLAWTWMSSPVTTSGGNLYAASATSARDAWAVGSLITSGGSAQVTLALHWNGTAGTQSLGPSS